MLINRANIPVIRKPHPCLACRQPIRTLCFFLCFLAAMSLVFVGVSKINRQCPTNTPALLCMANKHCAYLKRKTSSESYYLDLVPFMGSESYCINRNDYQDYLYKGIESTIDWINQLGNTLETDNDNKGEIVIPSKDKKKKQLLSDFKYQYDDEVILGLTRYEIGLWIIFGIFYFLRRYLTTCGNRKNMFDFMRPA